MSAVSFPLDRAVPFSRVKGDRSGILSVARVVVVVSVMMLPWRPRYYLRRVCRFEPRKEDLACGFGL